MGSRYAEVKEKMAMADLVEAVFLNAFEEDDTTVEPPLRVAPGHREDEAFYVLKG